MNSLKITFSIKSEFTCLHTVKWIEVLLFHTNTSSKQNSLI